MRKLILLIFCFIWTNISATDVVYNTDNNVNLTNDILLSIFTKRQKFWHTGEKITVFIKPLNSIEHSIFISDWLGISAYRYKKILKKEIYSGHTSSVKEVLSDMEMIHSIASTPFSIGYLTDGTLIYSSNVNNSELIDDLKVIYYE